MSSEQPQHVEIHNLNELRWILLRHRVLFFLWIFGRKNESHLFDEIRKGETALAYDAEHGIVRQTSVLNIAVRYIDPNGTEWVLKENRQEWQHKFDIHGKKRIDRRDHAYVSEKIEQDDIKPDGSLDAHKAIARALSEELDGVRTFTHLISFGATAMVKKSSSYPGLKTKFLVHNFSVNLPKEEWKQEYVEYGKEKSTYFVWVRKN